MCYTSVAVTRVNISWSPQHRPRMQAQAEPPQCCHHRLWHCPGCWQQGPPSTSSFHASSCVCPWKTGWVSPDLGKKPSKLAEMATTGPFPVRGLLFWVFSCLLPDFFFLLIKALSTNPVLHPEMTRSHFGQGRITVRHRGGSSRLPVVFPLGQQVGQLANSPYLFTRRHHIDYLQSCSTQQWTQSPLSKYCANTVQKPCPCPRKCSFSFYLQPR